MGEEKKVEEKPKEEMGRSSTCPECGTPLVSGGLVCPRCGEEEKTPEERLKELKIIIFTSSESEDCKPALEEVKSIAEEEKVEVEEIDAKDLDFPKNVIKEGGAVPTTCVVSGAKMMCHIGFGPEYKQKLLELMKKLRERIESKSEQ